VCLSWCIEILTFSVCLTPRVGQILSFSPRRRATAIRDAQEDWRLLGGFFPGFLSGANAGANVRPDLLGKPWKTWDLARSSLNLLLQGGESDDLMTQSPTNHLPSHVPWSKDGIWLLLSSHHH